ncbi:hypothetical protein IGJ55_002926 [Enterococcus sp. AZ170]|uniref:hypothetical protein n=1 Tax=unclassified Enterococcus TaxID=2608891 RepID=UPI003D291255
MKKKLAMCISGLALLLGIGSYLALSNSQISAEEKAPQSSNVTKKSLTTSAPFNGPSLFAQNSILGNNKFIPIGPNDTLPEGYYFFAKPNKNTRYFKVNKTTRNKILEYKHTPIRNQGSGLYTDDNNRALSDGTQAAYFSNVGEYQGKTVDMMISIEDGYSCRFSYTHNVGKGVTNSFGTVYSLMGPDKSSKITYSYFDNETGEPYVVKGIFSTFVDFNYNIIGWDHSQVDATYVNSNSRITYDTTSETNTKSILKGNGTDELTQPQYYVTGIFTGSSICALPISPYSTGSMGMNYSTNLVSRMKIPAPQLSGSLENDGTKHSTSFSISMKQVVPDRLSNFSKYGYLDYTIPVNDFYKLKSFKVVNYLDDTDVTSNFTLSGNKLEAKSSFLDQDTFYGTNYEITLNYELDKTKDFFGFYKDGYLEIPYDPITQSSDLDGVQSSNATTAKIKWDYQLEITANDVTYGQGEIKRFNQEPEAFKEKLLTDSKAKGKNLNLDTELPVSVTDMAIDSKVGTYPVTLSTQDGDVTLTKEIKVNVVAMPPKVAIPEAGTTVVSSKGVPYSFSGTVSDEDSEDLSLFVTIDDGTPTTIWDKQANTDLNQPIDFTYEIPGTQLLELGDHVVKVYAKDSEDNQSEVAQFTLDIRGYLAFKELPPETLDFNQTKIGSKGSYAKLNKGVDFSVEDYRGSNTSWKLVGSLTSELKDSATNTIIKDGIVYRDEEGNETPFTTDATVKLSTGKATANNVLFPINWRPEDKGIFIQVPPEVKKGNYKGSIEMSLVDAP